MVEVNPLVQRNLTGVGCRPHPEPNPIEAGCRLRQLLAPKMHCQRDAPPVGASKCASAAHAKSYRSWLPPSPKYSNKAASTTKSHTGLKSVMKKRIAKGVKDVKDLAPGKRPFSWKCPECGFTLNGTYGSVMSSKGHTTGPATILISR